MSTERNAYDAVAYPSQPFIHTHPDRLATMATLHGLSPAPVEQCRVLEVACSEGGNIIPMAYAIPGSDFVGFDLAGSAIERGQKRAAELGLKNLRLFAGDLMNAGADLGQFDYILAHGLYAWVPEAVSDRLLALCGELLTADGVAFISYNALPGGYVRNAVREMLLERVKGCGDVARQIGDASAWIRDLLKSRPESDPYRLLMEEHLSKMEERHPNAVFHDELSEGYRPVHFIDFARHAARHGLQFLSEAVLPPVNDPCYQFDLRTKLAEASGGDFLREEQMLDFVRARKFRETLLCRADRAVKREVAGERFRKLRMASRTTSSPGAMQGSTVFTLPGGIKLESNHPAAKLLLGSLERAWPRTISFAELEPALEETGFMLNADGTNLLMRLAVSKMIELHSWKAPLADSIQERPVASACSRQEIWAQSKATTLLHSVVDLQDALARRLLTLLDGTRDRSELAAVLKAEFPRESTNEIETGLGPALEFFYRAGFLEG